MLGPFDTATRELSTDKKPSLHLVIPTRFQLKRHLAAVRDDVQVIVDLKQRLSVMLDRYFHVTELHMAATLLDPRLRVRCDLVSSAERSSDINKLRPLIASCAQNNDESSAEPLAKRQKYSVDEAGFFGDLFSSPVVVPVDDEVDAYLRSTDSTQFQSISHYWQQQECVWPK